MITCQLSCHVHACLCDDVLVILDLRHDRYFSIKPGWMDAQVQNCCATNKAPRSEIKCTLDPAGLPATAIQVLQRHNLLVAPEDQSNASCKLEKTVSAPVKSLFHTSGLPWPGLRVSLHVLAAARRAARLLANRPIAEIINSIERRKAQCRSARLAHKTVLARRLVPHFMAVRPFYPRSYRCLFDSLALIEFLSGFGLFPSWVFGVAVNPFRAHCWVQDGDYVLNEPVETVQPYTPIMVV